MPIGTAIALILQTLFRVACAVVSGVVTLHNGTRGSAH